MKSYNPNFLNRAIHFIKYNNAFVLIVVFIFASFSLTMAASPTARESIYASSETVRSVDNSYLLSLDLNYFNFNLQIQNILEDQENFYVSYSYNTVAISDYVWKPIYKDLKFIVSKESLGEQDLGLYLANQLGQEIGYQFNYLSEAKKMEEEKGLSLKTATVEYSGLIGRMLSSEEKVFPGYIPVKPPLVGEDESEESQDEVMPTENTPKENTKEEIENQVVLVHEQKVEVDRELIRQAVEEILAQKNTFQSSPVQHNTVSSPEVPKNEVVTPQIEEKETPIENAEKVQESTQENNTEELQPVEVPSESVSGSSTEVDQGQSSE